MFDIFIDLENNNKFAGQKFLEVMILALFLSVIILLVFNKKQGLVDKILVFLSFTFSPIFAPIYYIYLKFKDKKNGNEINGYRFFSAVGMFTTSFFILYSLIASIKYYLDFKNPLIPFLLSVQTIGELVLKAFVLIILLFIQFKYFRSNKYKISIVAFLISYLISFTLDIFYSYLIF